MLLQTWWSAEKPGGHLENQGADGPWAPVSFEPWYIYINTKAVLEYCEAVWSGDGSGKNRYIKT